MAVVSNIYYAAKAGTEFYEMPDAHENTTLDDLYKRKEMSTRTVNVLRRAGYTTIEEVMETDETKLMKARDMGANTMCEVKRVIEKYQRGDL